ncbi:hypothetical protein GQX73_g8121 [Xylaria multiplex]|uniref:Uncharacterized protein n=1 Tax=Xylaria multiplex TaxID=323545 RepID=A0A7C8MLL6_9PEZI|nr:hypothetical protein GQX73_g8121 [Xylaria multiplex]
MASHTNIKFLTSEANSEADTIVCRKNRRSFYNKLFKWIETKPDKDELYQDLFNYASAKINARKQNRRQQQQLEQPTRSVRSTDDTLVNKDTILDEKPSYDYMAAYDEFEPQTSGLKIWVLMFMTNNEIYNMAPAMGRLDKRKSDSLLTFVRYLNPNYICFRVDHIINLVWTDDLAIPDMKSVENTIRAWNDAYKFNLRNSIIRACAAVSCFSHFRRFEKAIVHSKLLKNSSAMGKYFEDSACSMFAKLDNESPGSHIEKWRQIMNLGKNLSILAKYFGGEGFLLLLPLSELQIITGERLRKFHSTTALWKVLYDLLRFTEMGTFFRSMASTIGIPLIHHCCGGSGSPQYELSQRLNTIRLLYSLPQISEFTPRLSAHVLARRPDSTPFGYCGNLEVKHLTSNLSLMPLSLLQFVSDCLEPGIVEHLIRQNLPREWAVIGKEDISQPANKELLLCDYQGVMIPLLIDNGWSLFCYTNPIKSETDYLIKFINPTKSYERHQAALNLLSAWIPRNGPWIPNGLKLRLVKVIKSQCTDENDSGIHVILNAIAMARTGKPELRSLSKQVCKGLRIKYFVHFLHELQEVVNKEATKRAHITTGNPQST